MGQFNISDCIEAKSSVQMFIDSVNVDMASVTETLSQAQPQELTSLSIALSRFNRNEFEELSTQLVKLRRTPTLKTYLNTLDVYINAGLMVLNFSNIGAPVIVAKEIFKESYRPFDYLINELSSEQANNIAAHLFKTCSLIELYNVTEAVRNLFPESQLSAQLDMVAPHVLITKDLTEVYETSKDWALSKGNLLKEKTTDLCQFSMFKQNKSRSEQVETKEEIKPHITVIK